MTAWPTEPSVSTYSCGPSVSPVRPGRIAHALKLPRVSVVRRLEKLRKHGNVERVGNAYRVRDKVTSPNCRRNCNGV